VCFTWHAELATWAEAELACQKEGAHLAAYDNLIQQNEIEQYYIQEDVSQPLPQHRGLLHSMATRRARMLASLLPIVPRVLVECPSYPCSVNLHTIPDVCSNAGMQDTSR
jgi:hypothetical protein